MVMRFGILYQTRDLVMRAHPIVAVASAILVGLGVKLTFFSAPVAAVDREATRNVNIDGFQGRAEKLPVQKLHDMTFVFSIEE
jgi:hypothetical protein